MTLSCRPLSLPLIPLLLALTLLSGCDKPAAPPPPPGKPAAASASIAWREGDLEAAFAEAKQSGKPLLLYWGAAWCPPCNRLKTTLFKDPGFIARTRSFVAVHLDGDTDSAQAWGERFGIKGYPTIIVLRPDRSEITRLSGDADIAQLSEVLRVAARGSQSAKQLLDTALHHPATLSADDWAVLATHAWDMDDQLLDADHRVEMFTQLSQTAPQPALQRSFALLALEAAQTPPATNPSYRTLLDAVLADPAEVRANRDVLTSVAPRLIAAASRDPAERLRLSDRFNKAMDTLYADPSLPIVDRLDTAEVRIALARLAQGQPTETPPHGTPPPLPAELVKLVRQRVRWAVATAKTTEERQSTISDAAWLLGEIGDSSDAEQLVMAEVSRSKTPYYYMPTLAAFAEKRGDTRTALSWLKKGYETADAPTTRIAYGMRYVVGLIRLNPGDAAAIEATTGQLIEALAGQSDGYRERTRERFDKLGGMLKAWSKQHPQQGDQMLARLRQQAQGHCDSKAAHACGTWLS
ncbi:thioredoxin family protein [Xanthomonas maliensis]|uniref:thioredoxin family protein n=1 Tax=Xanthomonas maliensis TaxID=1321368 RepID=UPI00039AFC76|nr:thioredoxin family protein [Xanthomonas maliensis]KAB7768070.1 thioredoxin family protein [Xanthomonas maliensis]